MPDSNTTGSTDSRLALPETGPQMGSLPPHHEKRKNLADDKELCDLFWNDANQHWNRFNGQPEREAAEDARVAADGMYRASRRKPTRQAEKFTMSNVSDTGYHRRIRTVSAGEAAIFYNGIDPPAKYVPLAETDDYEPEDGKIIADQQNLLARYTQLVDKREAKVKKLNLLTNKYANYFEKSEWLRVVQTRRERRPKRKNGKIERDKDGAIKGWERKEIERTIADHPTIRLKDPKDIWIDATIEEMDMQLCILDRGTENVQTLHRLQSQGEIMNVDEIKAEHLYQGEQHSDELNRRKENADEGTSSQESNGLVEVWNVWMLAPIDKEGKWDRKKTLPTWHWGIFAGNINSRPVCLSLMRNPYNHGKQPYNMVHSHEDDKGAYHFGFPELGEDLYWLSTTIVNQAVDNNTLRNRKPFIQIGRSLTQDMTFSGNKIFHMERGATLTEVDVKDTTGVTMQFLDRIDDIQDKTFNTDKPITGEPLGGRTTAQEATNVFEQAQKPAIEKAKYFGDQHYPWEFGMDKDLWEQFGDPKRVIKLTEHEQVYEVRPGDLWGPLTVSVSSVLEFESTALRRQQLNAVTTNVMPFLGKFMAPGGGQQYGRDFFDEFKIKNGDIIFGTVANAEARSQAQRESRDMIDNDKVTDPQPDEAHDAHIETHQDILDEFKMLPKADRETMGGLDTINLQQRHIDGHKKLKTDQQPSAQAPPQQELAGPAGLGLAQGGQLGKEAIGAVA